MSLSIHYPCAPALQNPYNDLLINALTSCGHSTKSCNSITLLIKYIISGRVSLIHFHWLDRGGSSFSTDPKLLSWQILLVIICLYARLIRIKLVWTIHNLTPHNSRTSSFFFYRIVSRIVNAIIVLSPSAVQTVARAYRIPDKKISFIPHGCYRNAFDVKPKHRIPLELCSDIQLLYFGNISPYKGLDILADSLQELRERNDQIKPSITIIGKYEPAKYPQLVSKLQKLPDLIIIPGFVDDISLNQYLEQADIVILPFKDLLSSGSLIYALSAGKPVITSDIPSLDFYLDPSFSFRFKAGDVSSLANLIELIYTKISPNTLQLMGHSARNFAVSLNWTSIAKQTILLYSMI